VGLYEDGSRVSSSFRMSKEAARSASHGYRRNPDFDGAPVWRALESLVKKIRLPRFERAVYQEPRHSQRKQHHDYVSALGAYHQGYKEATSPSRTHPELPLKRSRLWRKGRQSPVLRSLAHRDKD